jgi:hypothetical protein
MKNNDKIVKGLEEILASTDCEHQKQVLSLVRIPPFRDRFTETSKCTKCGMTFVEEVDG